jgi:hypothetical protein
MKKRFWVILSEKQRFTVFKRSYPLLVADWTERLLACLPFLHGSFQNAKGILASTGITFISSVPVDNVPDTFYVFGFIIKVLD